MATPVALVVVLPVPLRLAPAPCRVAFTVMPGVVTLLSQVSCRPTAGAGLRVALAWTVLGGCCATTIFVGMPGVRVTLFEVALVVIPAPEKVSV